MSNYQQYTFDHWENGSTSNCTTVTPTQATTLTAYYTTGTPVPPPVPTTADITVKSVDLAGSPITGLWTEISTGDTLVNSGYTPLSYTATTNTQYNVCVSNYQQYTFDHWSDGSKNRCTTVTPTQATTLTAHFKTAVTIKVRSLGLDNSPITGLWTEISSASKLVKAGYTTLSYAGSSGTTYKACVSNYQNFVFDHWADGSTNSCKTITPTKSTTLTAYYRR